MPNVLAAVAELPTSLSTAALLSELVSLVTETRGNLHAAAVQERFAAWRLQAAASVTSSLRRNEQDPAFRDASKMVSTLAGCGINDYAVPARLVSEADASAKRGGSGMVAAMLLAPSWQWGNAPRLKDVPLWLAPLFAEHQFFVPSLFTVAGQKAAVLGRLTSALSDLAALAQANRGSQAFRSALEQFRANEKAASLAFDGSLEFRAARARLVSALCRAPQIGEVLAVSREWRPLRIGVVAQRLVAEAASGMVSLLERLDAGRFEVILFESEPSESEIVRHLTGRGASQTRLLGSSEDMAQTIRDAMLDVAIYVFDGDWTQSPVAPLCVNRSAPLQVVHDGTGLPSLLPGADFYLSGAADAPVANAERQAVLPGLAVVAHSGISYDGQPDQWTKEAMGIEQGAFVFVAAGLPGQFTAESLDTWASVLGRVPASKLVVCVPAPNGPVTDSFCGYIAEVLARRGIEHSRVSVISDATVATLDHCKGCLAGANVLLDLDGGGTMMALAAAELGIPTLTIRGSDAARSGPAALLSLAGAPELIATDGGNAAEIAVKLATDADFLKQISDRLSGSAAGLVALHDSFVRSEAFGRILEKAFDAIVASRREFENNHSPITAIADATPEALAEEVRTFTELGSGADAEGRARAWLVMEPCSASARGALARALAMRGQNAEASAAWLSVVELTPTDAAAWHELADASLKAGRRADGVQALETAIRIDPKRVDSWVLLGTLAQQSGDAAMLQDVLQILKELAPDDPRVGALAAEVVA